MEAPNHTHVSGRDGQERIDSEKYLCEVRRVSLEGVFAIEDRETFVVKFAGGKEYGGSEVKRGGMGRREDAGAAGDYGGDVREAQT